ncbi:foldase protein PrsA [Parapedomonas caeni]
MTLGLGLGLAIAPALAQSVGNALDSEGMPQNITVFGAPADPNVRKASAIVNGSVITDLDVDHRLALVITASGGRIPADEVARLRLQVLRNLIDERLQILEAKENDIEVGEADVEAAFARVAQNFGQPTEQFLRFLKTNGTSGETLKDQIRAEFAWNSLLRRRVEPFVSIGDDEIQAVIDRLEAAKGQEEYRLSEIFLAATPETEAETRANAERIVTQVRAGASFVAYARQFSEASTAAVGGDMGYMMLGQLRRGLEDVVPAMRIGQVSDPIRVAGGFVIISVTDKRKVLGPDPLNAVLTVKQVAVPLAPGTSREQLMATVQKLTTAVAAGGGCGRADAIAASVGGRVDAPDPQPLRSFPPGLHEQLERLQVGEATQPFGTQTDARIIILCGRDEGQESALPSYDDVYAQLNEQRISMMARRYLRDLRRDAIVDYR